MARPIKELHQENDPEVSYTPFRRRLLDKVPTQVSATIRLEHKPAEQADYCDGVSIVDPATGVTIKTHLFAASCRSALTRSASSCVALRVLRILQTWPIQAGVEQPAHHDEGASAAPVTIN